MLKIEERCISIRAAEFGRDIFRKYGCPSHWKLGEETDTHEEVWMALYFYEDYIGVRIYVKDKSGNILYNQEVHKGENPKDAINNACEYIKIRNWIV